MSLLDKILINSLFKAAHGRYADNAKNRRLHRVGQEYGHAAKEEVPGPGRKPVQQDDEQKNPLAAKLDTLSPTQLSKLVDVSEKKLKEFKGKGYEQGAKKLEEIVREARKRLMGDEAYEKKDLVQRVRNSVSDEKDAGKVEQDWEDKIRDYISEHYPTQANVTAETNSPKGREERERMKNDPELKRMLEQSSREFKEADEREQAEREKKEPVEEKKPTKEDQEAREKEVQSKVSALGKKLVQTMKDGGDTKGVEKEISEALKEASDKQLRDTAIALKSSDQTPAVKRALKLTEKERNRRKQASGLFSDTSGEEKSDEPKTSRKTTESEGKGGDDVKVEARLSFDDIPNSGKVKLAKYLSGVRKQRVDRDFESIKGFDDSTVNALHDGLVKKFNEGFDDMKKADRAEAFYKIAKVKAELDRRFKEATKADSGYSGNWYEGGY